ncbi:MAG: ispE [Firmicutes bacterium]|nr:ispE [Bacillota bacterium]
MILSVDARAKINLALDILYKRSDGYHEVEMVMQEITLADKVLLDGDADEISVSTNIPDLSCGQDNLAYRAAALIRDTLKIRRGVRITLDKRIPVAAGLAGGSANAAAVLKGLNQLWGLGLSLRELEELGSSLGSDVPFCLNGGTMLATGRGEKLSSLPGLAEVYVVLAKPPVAVSTAWVYGNYRPEIVTHHPDIPGMVACLEKRDLPGVAGKMANVLESVTMAAYSEISDLKNLMLDCGLVASMMSGSGPTVFGLTADYRKAHAVAELLRRNTAAWVAIAETVDDSEGKHGAAVRTYKTE